MHRYDDRGSRWRGGLLPLAKYASLWGDEKRNELSTMVASFGVLSERKEGRGHECRNNELM